MGPGSKPLMSGGGHVVRLAGRSCLGFLSCFIPQLILVAMKKWHSEYSRITFYYYYYFKIKLHVNTQLSINQTATGLVRPNPSPLLKRPTPTLCFKTGASPLYSPGACSTLPYRWPYFTTVASRGKLNQ